MKNSFYAAPLLAAASSFGQTSFSGDYTFSGTSGAVASFAYNGSDIPNLTEGDLTRSGLTLVASTNNFRASGWALDPVVGSLTGSIDTSKYFEFGLTADAGYSLDMLSITFGIGRSGTSARSFAWRSSADGYAANIADYTIPSDMSGSVSHSSGVLTLVDPGGSVSVVGITLNLSAATFQDLSSVTFRFYGWNAEISAGTAGLQGPLSFAGTFAGTSPAVPEPSTYGLILGGLALAAAAARRRRTR